MDLLRFLLKRTFYHRASLLPVLLGVLAAVSILCSAPLLATAAGNASLQASLQTTGAAALTSNLEARLFARAHDNTSYAQATKAVTANVRYYLGSQIAAHPPIQAAQLTDMIGYRPGEVHQVKDSSLDTALDLWFFSTMTPAHLTLTSGRLPSAHIQSTSTNQGTAYDVEAMISPDWAKYFHLQLNDVLEVTGQTDDPDAYLRVHFVGFFQPKNPHDPAWFDEPDVFTSPYAPTNEQIPHAAIWLNQDAFEQAIPQLGLRQEMTYFWFYYLNHPAITLNNAASVQQALTTLKARFQLFQVDSTDPNAGYDALTRLDELLQTALSQLTVVNVATLVAIFPGLALLLVYLLLAATALAEHTRDETSLLKSRGASRWQVFLLSALEALLLCIGALLLAPLLATQLTNLLERLVFQGAGSGALTSLPVIPTGQAYLYAGIAAFLCMLALVLPTFVDVRSTLLQVKREAGRSHHRMRRYLIAGLFLVALGAFGAITLLQRDAFFTLDARGKLAVDWVAVTSPTLLLLGAIGLSLVLLPPMLTLLDRVGRRTPDIAVALATQQLARRPASYSRLFLVLTLTLALGSFAALFNGTLATSYADRAAYLSGADLRLVEGQANLPDLQRQAAPLADHLSLLPGAIDGMNALRDSVALPTGALQGNVTTLAVDPARLPRLVSWRADFANAPLSTLMQKLQTAPTPQGALPAIVDDQVIQATHDQIGSHLSLLLDGKSNVDFVIVGSFHYFPTLETGQMALVCDLSSLLQQLNRNPLLQVAPNEVWLKLAPTAPVYTAQAVMDRLASNPQHRQVQVNVQQVYDRAALAASLRNDPLHFSTAGALLLDVLVAAVLSVIGFVALFALIVQRRAFEFGVLRVLGLSWGQLSRSLGWEQIVMLCWAVAVGIGVGIVLAQLALPALSTDTWDSN